jgi:RNA polymerase sigma-70 factor, ECF subfamily
MKAGDEIRAQRDHEDGLLLARLQRGDLSSLSDLYDRYGTMSYSLAMKIVRDALEAEDIVQDAFAAIAERAQQFEPSRGTVCAWLLTTVRNLSLDRARRKLRRAQIVEQELRPAMEDASVAYDGPEFLMTLRAEQTVIRRALAGLPDAQRATIHSAFFEGLSYPEIATRDGVPLGTIKSRAARALHALRATLSREGWGDVSPAVDPDESSSADSSRTP